MTKKDRTKETKECRETEKIDCYNKHKFSGSIKNLQSKPAEISKKGSINYTPAD